MPASLLFEIGCEEIPGEDARAARSPICRRSVAKKLDAARLAHGAIAAYGTPRRLAVIVTRSPIASPSSTSSSSVRRSRPRSRPTAR